MQSQAKFSWRKKKIRYGEIPEKRKFAAKRMQDYSFGEENYIIVDPPNYRKKCSPDENCPFWQMIDSIQKARKIRREEMMTHSFGEKSYFHPVDLYQ